MSVSRLARKQGKILDEIMAYHRERLPQVKRQTSLSDLRAFSSVAPPVRDLKEALATTDLNVIAACQKASPVEGLLVRQYDPVALAEAFVAAGATAVSVCTDARHYQGYLEDLRDAREKGPSVPLLRRDFIFDPYQVYESRVAGADAIFLLAAVLGDKELARLAELTEQLGMTAVIEVGSSEEAERVRALQPSVVHINRRDWGTFRVRETAVAEIRPFFPPQTMVIGGGGVRDEADAARLAQLEYDAILLEERSARDAAKDSSFISALAAAGKANV